MSYFIASTTTNAFLLLAALTQADLISPHHSPFSLSSCVFVVVAKADGVEIVGDDGAPSCFQSIVHYIELREVVAVANGCPKQMIAFVSSLFNSWA